MKAREYQYEATKKRVRYIHLIRQSHGRRVTSCHNDIVDGFMTVVPDDTPLTCLKCLKIQEKLREVK